jgi:selenocysteine-specific elongation factor
MHVIGTAGHVDHGKSSLVRALTGTDPDRLIEEQLRGMTLDLGFAQLRFDDGVEAGIIDVPGHERYIRNMLAGAAGMELLLLVVAANEGVRPQTVEHLAILDFLNVRRAIVVLTKRDLADDAMLDAVTEEVRRATRRTIAHAAAALAVSTVTGEGLAALREAIHAALIELPPRAPEAPAFLPIDRVFSRTGAGTIVTGTLMQGTLRVGDTLRLSPPGRDVRVRSLQVFGAGRDAVAAGARVAVNVPGVEVAEIHRGAVLADPAFAADRFLQARFRSFAGGRALLKRRTAVRAALGAAEVLGVLEIAVPPHDDEAVDATLRLREAVVTYPGQPFVLRSLSPMVLLGGGTIVAGAGACADEPPDADIAVLARALAAAGLAAFTPAELAARANLRLERVDELGEELVAHAGARLLGQPRAYLDGAAGDALSARIAASLARREAETPWIAGVTLQALARELDLDEPLLLRFLRADAEAGRIVAHGGYFFSPAHVPRLSDEQRTFFVTALAQDAAAPLLPNPLDGIVASVRSSRIGGVGAAFETLIVTGALVKVGAEVYTRAQLAEIRQRLETAIMRDGPITAAQFRDAVGTTRKYAVPLLEWFDANGITVRDGDLRRLRAGRSPAAAGTLEPA